MTGQEKIPRWLRPAWYGLLAAAAWMLAEGMRDDFNFFPAMEAWSMMLGYMGFCLIACTLVIGPVKQWLPARWTVYLLALRRDIGIMGGLAAILHVILVVILFEGEPQLFFAGSQEMMAGWLGLFFWDTPDGGLEPNMSMVGIANYMGAIAILGLLALFATSSDRAERFLGGGTWKRLHMYNPALFLLVTFHGLIYVQLIKGEPHTYRDILWMTAAVLLIRIAAYTTTVIKRTLQQRSPD
ncbi:hypothetical protein G3578_07685 [Brevibacillus sp. SYP-B805]|uniref:ferric reductase-like transmembrane domain-containing protein n=1 Tax=Brevibacillus sp. SYP-B805 TaxID=1578199 RepID=UPI0013EBDC3B|nr:ferric reductase-like transmembrane domain-containing protein [Brevibacillus sp. SYP-B805]NGQ95065.1 hypothetical protein [Brevibacillus sp. SYP-B805]